MSFFKNLFRKGESFVPTPTQSIPGLEPIVVQAIENLFPDVEDQKKAFTYALEFKGSELVGDKNSTRKLLAMLADTNGKIESLPKPTVWSIPQFHFDLGDIFPRMKDAEAWVKSITKPKI